MGEEEGGGRGRIKIQMVRTSACEHVGEGRGRNLIILCGKWKLPGIKAKKKTTPCSCNGSDFYHGGFCLFTSLLPLKKFKFILILLKYIDSFKHFLPYFQKQSIFLPNKTLP